jgi:hypothetical protein
MGGGAFSQWSDNRVADPAFGKRICRLSGLALAARRPALQSNRSNRRHDCLPPGGRPASSAIGHQPGHAFSRQEDNLWDLAEPLQATARDRYLDLWRQLRSENAPLRVLRGDRLVSAPISFFDSLLMSFVTEDWQRVARVVGRSLVSGMDDSLVTVDDILLRARVNALVESGRLEIRGKSDRDIFFSEVRLVAAVS